MGLGLIYYELDLLLGDFMFRHYNSLLTDLGCRAIFIVKVEGEMTLTGSNGQGVFWTVVEDVAAGNHASHQVRLKLSTYLLLNS